MEITTNFDKQDFIDGFCKAIKSFINGADGTYYHYLNKNEEKHWAIVVGWASGWGGSIFEEGDNCIKGDYRISAKVAYQPSNSIMQSDYDLDWTMPYDDETGEFDELDIAIYPDTDLTKAAETLLNYFLEYK